MELTPGVTVVVPSTGQQWTDMAHEYAIPSALRLNTPATVVEAIAPTLRDARNEGLARVRTEWTVFLDADDRLPVDYLDGLQGWNDDYPVDAWVPPVYYWHPGGGGGPARYPKVSGHDHDCRQDCLTQGNYIVIGAPVRTATAVRVGGFRDFGWSEDWDFWLRIHLAGGRIVTAAWLPPYEAHWRPDSRNRAGRANHLVHHNAILRANGLPEV